MSIFRTRHALVPGSEARAASSDWVSVEGRRLHRVTQGSSSGAGLGGGGSAMAGLGALHKEPKAAKQANTEKVTGKVFTNGAYMGPAQAATASWSADREPCFGREDLRVESL